MVQLQALIDNGDVLVNGLWQVQVYLDRPKGISFLDAGTRTRTFLETGLYGPMFTRDTAAHSLSSPPSLPFLPSLHPYRTGSSRSRHLPPGQQARDPARIWGDPPLVPRSGGRWVRLAFRETPYINVHQPAPD